MAQYSYAAAGWVPVAHADGASALANNSYEALHAVAASTDRVTEVFIGGEASSSTVNRMAVRRNSTNATTPGAPSTPAPLSPLSAASAALGYVNSATGPTIASTGHLLNLAFNAFGGVIRWVAAPGQELYITTATAPNSEVTLDSISGLGTVSSHFLFEEL